MSAEVVELNDDNFEEQVRTGVTLVDFWAPWCGPCKMQTPIVESLAAKVGDKAKVAKVNVDDAQKTAAKFAIRSIPSLIVIKDGESVQQMVGLRQEQELISAIEQAL